MELVVNRWPVGAAAHANVWLRPMASGTAAHFSIVWRGACKERDQSQLPHNAGGLEVACNEGSLRVHMADGRVVHLFCLTEVAHQVRRYPAVPLHLPLGHAKSCLKPGWFHLAKGDPPALTTGGVRLKVFKKITVLKSGPVVEPQRAHVTARVQESAPRRAANMG